MLFYDLRFLIEQLRVMIYVAPAILFAVVLHEYAHGRVSTWLGDPTPKASGRLSLNPFRHLDLWGTLCLLFFHVGWAKPVPIDPRYYKDRRKGIILTALAGPAANLIAALLLTVIEVLVYRYTAADSTWAAVVILLAEYSARINIGLALFNLIPIPPLDGSRILGELFPRVREWYGRWRPYWTLILLLLLIIGVLSRPLNILNHTVLTAMQEIVMNIFHVIPGSTYLMC